MVAVYEDELEFKSMGPIDVEDEDDHDDEDEEEVIGAPPSSSSKRRSMKAAGIDLYEGARPKTAVKRPRMKGSAAAASQMPGT